MNECFLDAGENECPVDIQTREPERMGSFLDAGENECPVDIQTREPERADWLPQNVNYLLAYIYKVPSTRVAGTFF